MTSQELIDNLERRADRGSYIKATWIEYANLVNPEKAKKLQAARQKVLDERIAEETRQKLERQKEERREREQNIAQMNDELSKFENVVRKGGITYNSIRVCDKTGNTKETSPILYYAEKFGIAIPLRTQGWIKNALSSMEIKDGKLFRYGYNKISSDGYKSHKHGKVTDATADYIDKVFYAICNSQPQE